MALFWRRQCRALSAILPICVPPVEAAILSRVKGVSVRSKGLPVPRSAFHGFPLWENRRGNRRGISYLWEWRPVVVLAAVAQLTEGFFPWGMSPDDGVGRPDRVFFGLRVARSGLFLFHELPLAAARSLPHGVTANRRYSKMKRKRITGDVMPAEWYWFRD